MGLRDWIDRLAPAGQLKANQLGIVYPAPAGEGYVDLPVWSPTSNHYTTAWSGQVPVLDPGEQLETYAAGLRAIDPALIWKTQPSVRKVVSFVARCVASTPIKAYDRRGDDERIPLSSGQLPDLLRSPAPHTTPFRFWNTIVCDWLLNDKWAVWKVPSGRPEGLDLVRIPPRRVRFPSDSLGRIQGIEILTDSTERPWRGFDPDDFLFDYGYSPDGAGGVTPMQTLSELLAESAEAVRWRRQTWANGARVSGIVERPAEANELEGWDDAAKERWRADFDARFRGDGPDAGGTALLEDGMHYVEPKAFSAVDMADLAYRQLTDAEVASAFHIPPELVGAREGNYSNVREFRQMLYRDALGPYYTPLKQVLNASLVPQVTGPRKRIYVDVDLDSKLLGSFEERASVLSQSVGAPWLTRNEARAQDNRKPVDGGDELITPLNVIAGGQPNPQTPTGDPGDEQVEPAESPEPPKAIGRGLKSLVPDTTRDRLLFDFETDLRRFAKRQQAAVTSALGGKATPPLVGAWDQERWDRELKGVLAQHLGRAVELRASLVASQLDSEPDLDELARIVDGRAGGIAAGWNAKTYGLLAAAVVEPEWAAAVGVVFAALAAARAQGLATSASTELTGAAALRAAAGAGPVSKRWVVRSKNPRSSHSALAGETVPIDAAFSNGAQHPGAGNLPVSERARCTCDVELQREDS